VRRTDQQALARGIFPPIEEVLVIRTITALLGLSMLTAAGWRDAGQAKLPTSWSTVAWETPVAGGSWSSPIVHGDTVYVTAEPTRLTALSLSDGSQRWSFVHPIQDALTPAQVAEFEQRKADAERLETKLTDLRRTFGRKRREIRRGNLTWEDVAPLQDEINGVRAELDVLTPFYTPERGDGLGYSVPTPHADDSGVVAAFGTGMVVARGHDGKLQWQRWLGVAEVPTRGYHGMDAASVVTHGDTLLVAHGTLHALDRKTGAVRWTGPNYLDYGTPTVVEVAGKPVVLTPDGHALSLANGRVLADGLGELWYVGPTAHDGTVWWVGRADGEMEGAVQARGITLAWKGDGLVASERFDRALSVKDRVYANPTFADGHTFVVTVRGTLIVLDAAGNEVHSRKLKAKGQFWSAPTAVDGQIVATSSEGASSSWTPRRPSPRPTATRCSRPSPAPPGRTGPCCCATTARYSAWGPASRDNGGPTDIQGDDAGWE
jgi:outer membrane protein assembly factor BamB